MVTIITLSLGLSDGLKLTLKSVNRQDHFSEHIVVDGSGNFEVLDYCAKNFPTVKVLIQKPQGIYQAMNYGLNWVDDNSHVLFLNESDFLLGPDAISNLVKSCNNLDSWVFGGTIAFHEKQQDIRLLGFDYPNWRNFKKGLMLIPHPSTLIPARWLKTLEGFDVSFKIAADSEMAFRIFRRFGPANHTEFPISAHELGGISTIQMNRSKWENRKARLQNFPLQTLAAIPYGLLSRKKCQKSLTSENAYRKPLHYRHFSGCSGQAEIPFCCRLALLE